MKQDLYQEGLFQPDPPGDDFDRLPERVRLMWRVRSAVWNVSLCAAVCAVLGVAMPAWLDWSPWWACGAAAFVPWSAWRFVVYGRKWAFTGYRLDAEEVWSRDWDGLRELSWFPYGRVQTVDVSSGWWERKFKVADVDVSIGVGAMVSFGPVDEAEAVRMRTVLTEVTRERAVEL